MLIHCSRLDDYAGITTIAWDEYTLNHRNENDELLGLMKKNKSDGLFLGRLILPVERCSASLSVVKHGSGDQHNRAKNRLTERADDLCH